MSPHQQFTYRQIPRTTIQNAPYNPRVISQYARKKLLKKMTADGLVEPLVWNETTGNLVSGHQRISIIDTLEGHQDYDVGVAVVQLDPVAEREQNLFFNNLYAQGGYNPQMFAELLQDPSQPTIEGMGFSKADIEVEFGASPEIDPSFKPLADAQGALVADLQAVEASRKRWNDLAKEQVSINADIGMDDSDYSVAVIFDTRDEYEAFLAGVAAADITLAEGMLPSDALLDMLEEPHRWR